MVSYIEMKDDSVQSLNHVWLFATPWTATHQSSLSITNSQSLLKLMSIVSAMPSNRLIFYHPLLLPPSIFPSTMVFSNESVLHITWRTGIGIGIGRTGIGISASALVPPMNIQDWFPLRLTAWISLQSKGLLRVFSNMIKERQNVYFTKCLNTLL